MAGLQCELFGPAFHRADRRFDGAIVSRRVGW